MASSLTPTDKSDASRSKHARRKDARPGELLEAALDLFVEKGFAATRSEEVAIRAGVSKGTLFLYFPSKEELFQAVVREAISQRFTEWNRVYEEFEGSTAEMIRVCYRVWWEKVGNTKASGLTKLVMSEARNFPEMAAFYQREVVAPGHELIKRIIQRGIDRGEFRPVDANYAVYSVLAPMNFLMMWKHSLGSCVDDSFVLDPQTYLDMQVETVLYGLCTRDDNKNKDAGKK